MFVESVWDAFLSFLSPQPHFPQLKISVSLYSSHHHLHYSHISASVTQSKLLKTKGRLFWLYQMLTRPHTNPRRVPLRKVEGCGACVKTAQIKFLVTVSKAAHNVGNKYSILWGICKFDEVMISVHYKVVCVTNSVLDDSGPNCLQTVNELLLCSSGLIHHHHDHLHPMRQDLAGRFMVIFNIYSLDSSPASKSCFFSYPLLTAYI